MEPCVTAYRYGSKRQPKEGFRIGTSRYVPRGVSRKDWQCRHYFDLWLPLLAPKPELVSKYQRNKIDFKTFSRHYKTQMKVRESQQVIELLAAISLFQPISVGCFCKDESLCHRSILKQLILKEAKGKVAGFSRLLKNSEAKESLRFASPVCFAEDSE